MKTTDTDKRLERAETLLKAAHELLKKQRVCGFSLDVLGETVFYDGAECDGYVLMEDIEEWFDEAQNAF